MTSAQVSGPPPVRTFTGLRRASRLAFALLVLLALAAPAGANTASDPASLCDAAAAQASRETGVPLSVLRAISLTETGRQKDGAFRPWPWTVNMEGAGKWFDTVDEAQAYVFRHHARGARSFDVGCFQLNFRWHGQHFASIEEMFQPLANARYAARFLADLHAETGDWSKAAGAYHSRTPRYANRYSARFDRIRARLDGTPVPATGVSESEIAAATQAEMPGELPPLAAPVAEIVPRVNTFPLLQANAGPTGMGSLVPLGAPSGRGLFDPAPPEEADDAG